MLLHDYLQNPCGQLSIPYWKHKGIQLPPDMNILHHRDYSPEAAKGYTDQVFFRLIHHLQDIPQPYTKGFLTATCSPQDADLIAQIINDSYTDIRVDSRQIRKLSESPAYCPALWILMREEASLEAAGCAIGEFDPESGEMSIEWMQVLPRFRCRGIGAAMVTELLRRVPAEARFATGSGRTDNKTNPEGLYRRCGFAGQDYWHILTKEN